MSKDVNLKRMGRPPKKKAKRKCISCGQFTVSNEDYCEKHLPSVVSFNAPTESIQISDNFGENQLTNDESADTVLPFSNALANDAFLPPVTFQQQHVCSILGVVHASNIYDNSEVSAFLSPPLRTSEATGDGNCFFNAVSLCICGNESLSQSLRSNACNLIKDGPFPAFLVSPYNSGADYLQATKMTLSGTYSTEVEICAMARFLNFNIFVYTNEQSCWLKFPPTNTNNAVMNIYLHYKKSSPFARVCNHFEPVLSVSSNTHHQNAIELPCSRTHTITYETTQLKRKTVVSDTQCSEDRNLSSISERKKASQNPIDVTMNDASFDNEHCKKCFRRSTKHYPFELLELKGFFLQRKFGKALSEGDLICENCLNYVKTSPSWQNAWAAVLFQLMFLEKSRENQFDLIEVLPAELLKSWFHLMNHTFANSNMSEKRLADITFEKKHFHSLTRSYTAENLLLAFDLYWAPKVRCPVGCFEFLSRIGFLPFQHFLNYLDPNFRAFSADSTKLKGSRPDFLDPFNFLNVFTVKSSVILHDTLGLCLATCQDHDRGCVLQYCHVPRNPATGVLQHPQSARLSPLAPTMRTVQPAKIGVKTHTYSMVEASGGFSGISSISLRHQRNLNVPSNFLLPATESLMLKYRLDIPFMLNKMCKDSLVTEDFIRQTSDYQPMPDCSKVSVSLASSNTVCMADLVDTKRFLSTQEKTNITPVVTPKNNFCDGYGSKPDTIRYPSKLNNKCSLASLLLLKNSECFNNFNDSSFQVNLLKIFSAKKLFQFNKALDEFQSKCELKNVQQLTLSTVPTLLQEGNILIVDNLENARTMTTPVKCVFVRSESQRKNKTIEIPQEIEMLGRKLFLTSIAAENHLNYNDYFVTFRAGKEFNNWWCFDKSPVPKKMSRWDWLSSNKGCNVMIYVNLFHDNVSNLEVFGYLGGQSKIICEEHGVPLSVDFKKSGYFCCIKSKNGSGLCNNKSSYRCPQPDCSACLCRNHSRDYLLNGEISRVELRPIDNALNCTQKGTTESDESESHDFDSAETEDFEFFEPAFLITDSGVQDETAVITDSGIDPLFAESSTMDAVSCPLHVLLNGFCKLKQNKTAPYSPGNYFKRFFQNFASYVPGVSVPLFQPEGSIFANIFWKQLQDGSIPGAMPFFLLNSKRVNASVFNHDGLHEHMKVRLKDHSIPTSTFLPYVNYAFDCVLNLKLYNQHTDDVFRRGLQNVTIKNQNLSKKQEESVLKFDSADTRKNVNELSTAMATETPDMFVTMTVNLKEHPGLRQLFRKIDENFGVEKTELKTAAVNSCMVLGLRLWEHVVEFLIEYLKMSLECILGDIVKLWGRAEFQEFAGNYQHYHLLIWLSNKNVDYHEIIQCSEKAFAKAFEDLITLKFGRITNHFEAVEILQKCMKVQSHSCEKGKFRCMKKIGVDGKKVCRFPAQKQSHCHSYYSFNIDHSEEAHDILQQLQLSVDDERFFFVRNVTEELECGKFTYAASKLEHVSPTSAKLFALTLSSCNVQRISRRMSERYLNKYAAGKEEHAVVRIKPFKSDKLYTAETEDIQNKKISGVQHVLAESEKLEKKTKHLKTLRFAHTESAFFVLEMPYVITTFDFVHVTTLPLEFRGGVIKKRPQLIGDEMNNAVTAYFARKDIHQLPVHRQLTESQKLIEVDVKSSQFSVDKISIFSLRPPELLCVRRVKYYFSWFVREKVSAKDAKAAYLKFINRNCLESNWIDGLGFLVKLRPSAVKDFQIYLESQTFSGLDCLRRSDAAFVLNNFSHSQVYSCFVSDNKSLSTTNAELVETNILPNNPVKFLLSILYSFGEFDTEIDLFNVTSLKEAFVKSNIIPDTGDPHEHVLLLLKRFIFEKLVTTPGGTKSFDRILVAAHSCFKSLIINDEIVSSEFPATLMSTLTDQMEKKISNFLDMQKRSLIEAIQLQKFANLPTTDALMAATIENSLAYPANLTRGDSQSIESFQEQQTICESIKTVIMGFLAIRENQIVKHELIMGPPGTGKTFICSLCLSFALGAGLFCHVTSLAARRARQFGGIHIHRLFCLSINNELSVTKVAEKALKKLHCHPERKALLLRLDVLMIEEIGLISAQHWAAMDLIMQSLKEVNVPFGGILVLATGDPCQLPSITGHNVFCSPLMITSFNIHLLNHFVRMEDPRGQIMLKLMWEKPIPADKITAIVKCISEECQFVVDWEQLTDQTIMKVFGRRKAVEDTLERHFENVKNSGVQYKVFKSRDEICPKHACNWKLADSEGTKFLNKEVREPEKLFVHMFVVLKITENCNDLNIPQGTLCLVVKMPTDTDNSIDARIIPAGKHSLSDDEIKMQVYENWHAVKIVPKPGFIHNFKGCSLRRVQYPLCNNVAATVHTLMGDTFPQLATSISHTSGNYSIWLASQLFVIVSRVRRLKNLTFVGDKSALLNSLEQILYRTNPQEFMMYDNVRRLAGRRSSIIDISKLSYIPFRKTIPVTENGFVYVLLSLSNRKFDLFYVGETTGSLQKRLYDHNTGNGHNFTKALHKQPWAITAFINNFTNNDHRFRVEHDINQIFYQQSPKSLQVVIQILRNYVDSSPAPLTLSICGEVRRLNFVN